MPATETTTTTRNTNLRSAKTAKNDEFYTKYADIEKEINQLVSNNPSIFAGRSIICPCNDLGKGGFIEFFKGRFEQFGIKSITGISFEPTGNHAHKVVISRNQSGHISEATSELLSNGDFRSPEVVTLIEQSDMVITNPPFSLFREFIDLLARLKKHFYIVGNKNCVNYNNVFHEMCKGTFKLGFTSPSKFDTPSEETGKLFGLCRWYTNMPIVKPSADFHLHSTYIPEKYPKFENFDAINVNRVSDIPRDYEGVMGVPITFMEFFDPEQYEILGRSGDTNWVFNECPFFTPPSKDKQKAYKAYYKNWRVQNSYILDCNGMPKCIYYRLFIKRRRKS